MLSPAVTLTPPVGEPISLDQAKAWLRVDGDALDDQVTMLIGAARAELEGITGQRLLDQEVTFRADSWADLAALRVGPVRDVVEVSYRDAAGDEQVLAPAAYELIGTGLERGIIAAPNASLPPVQARPGAITVRLAVGYGASGDDAPQDLRWALLALIRGKAEDRAVDVSPLIINHRL